MRRPPRHPPYLPTALPAPPSRAGRVRWSALVFLVAFTALLIVVSRLFLLPALDAARQAGDADRQRLKAWSTLVLMLMLFILLAGLLLTLRIGRFFFPRSTGPRQKTQYVDAWAEAGKRLTTPPPRDE